MYFFPFFKDEVAEQNFTLEEYQQSVQQHLQQVTAASVAAASNRPRTLSVSTSISTLQNHTNHPPPTLHRASVFVDASTFAKENSSKKKQNCQIAKELSDLVVYCQSVKFKGFYKAHNYQEPTTIPTLADKAANAGKETLVTKSSTPVRKTGLRSLESTPSSSSGSLNR